MKDNEHAQLVLMSQLLHHHTDMAHIWTKMLYDETDSPELVELARSLWPIVGPEACDPEWLQSTMAAWHVCTSTPTAAALGALMTAQPGPSKPPQTAVGALDPRPLFRRLSGAWGVKNACVITRIDEYAAVIHARNDAGSRPHTVMCSRHAYDGIDRRMPAVGDAVWVYMDQERYPTVVTPRGPHE